MQISTQIYNHPSQLRMLQSSQVAMRLRLRQPKPVGRRSRALRRMLPQWPNRHKRQTPLGMFRESRAGTHYRPDLQPRLGSVLLEMLEELYYECLIAKGTMGSYWGARYEYLWPDANTVMDRKACTSMSQSNDERKVMLTYWPAVRCSKTVYDGVEEVWFASKARVRACPSLE